MRREDVEMDKAFKLLIAFLLENKLMEGSRLIFFSDGATCIFVCCHLFYLRFLYYFFKI